jgi:hypothetical protein
MVLAVVGSMVVISAGPVWAGGVSNPRIKDDAGEAPSDPKPSQPVRVNEPKEPTEAKEPAGGAGSSTLGIPGYWGMAASSLKLSEEQKPRYRDAALKMAKSTKQWKTDHAAMEDELKAALEKAKGASDAAGADKAKAGLKDLEAKLSQLEDAGRKEILAVLSEEQLNLLQGYNLFTGMATRFGAADLSDVQKATLRGWCAERGAAVRAAAGDKRAADELRDALAKRVETELLTDAQREAMKQPKKKGGKKGGKSAPTPEATPAPEAAPAA